MSTQRPEMPQDADRKVAQHVTASGGSVGAIIGHQVNHYYAAEGHPPDRDRLALIAQVRRTWVGADARLPLALEERPDAVPLPIALQYQELRRPPRALPPAAPIAEVFDALGGALLILGAPGAGKTTLLRQLCAALLDRAEADAGHPVPAIFNLSSWAERRGQLEPWIVGELRGLYGVPRKTAERWVQERVILPLLDGLDEVAGLARDACVGAVNAYRGERGGPVAVCSRLAEYEALATQLRLAAAVAVLPLADAQVDAYLAAGGERLAGLRAIVAADPALHAIMRAPLMLTVADVGAAELSQSQADRDWQATLWDAFLATILGRRAAIAMAPRRTLLRRLRSLAQLMIAHSQSVFLIERIQPQWLPNRWLFGLAWAGSIILGLALMLAAMTLLGALAGALLSPWAAALTFGALAGPSVFTLVGFLGGVLGWLTLVIAGVPGRAFFAEVEPFERVRWSWNGLVAGALAWVVLIGIQHWSGNLSLGFAVLDVIPAYILAIGVGLTGGAMEATTRLNEGMRRSLQVTALVSYAAAVPLLFLGLSAILRLGEEAAIGVALVILGVGAGLGVGMAKGGLSVIKHVVIRLLLAASGALPWNLRSLLDAGADRLILRRVGGGYEFIHRTLAEHLAGLGDPEIERVTAENERDTRRSVS
jgi:hypothetical protein